MFTKIWNWCGDVKITFYLLLFISLNLAVGSYFIKFNSALFKPLSHLLLQEWFVGYGKNEPFKILWLGFLLGLLTLLGINTLVCALNRLGLLWPKRNQMGLKIFSVKISPSLIHICFLIILSGHFLSLILGYNLILSVKPGGTAFLPGGTQIKIIDQGCEYFQTPPSLRSSIKQCTVTLSILSGGQESIKSIRFLQPLSWQGYTIHLDMAKRSGARPKLKLVIKKDPGLKLIFLGFSILIVLMLWYLPRKKIA